MISSLKKNFSNNDLYGELLLVRARNLRWLKAAKLPKFSWKQPNAEIPDHPGVERFLKSDEVTFVYQGFNETNAAVSWINQFAGVHDNYSFNAVARHSNGINVEVILQKDRALYERLIKQYEGLMSELEDLEEQLKGFPEELVKLNSLKRPLTSDDELAVPKKVLHVNED